MRSPVRSVAALMIFLHSVAIAVPAAPTPQQQAMSLSDAEAALKKAEANVTTRLEKDPLFVKRRADVAARQKAIANASKGVNPAVQAACDKAKSELDRQIEAAMSADTAVHAAREELDRAKRRAAAEAAAADAAEAERMKDPIYGAMKTGKLVIGMTEEQADAAMKREKKVLVTDIRYKAVEWGFNVPLEGGQNAWVRKWGAWIENGKISRFVSYEDEDPGFSAVQRQLR